MNRHQGNTNEGSGSPLAWRGRQQGAYRLVQERWLSRRALKVVAVGVVAGHPSPSHQARARFVVVIPPFVVADARRPAELGVWLP